MQSLTAYIKQVRSVQWFICVIPLGGQLLKGQTAFVFPPLGPETGVCSVLALALAGVFAILPWMMPAARRLIIAVCTTLALAVSIVSYVYFAQTYVVSIPTPNGRVVVSIGSTRSPFAQRYFPTEISDAEMLMERGPYESEIQKLWTKRSITDARLGLYISYVGCLLLLNFLVGVIAREDDSSQPSTNAASVVSPANHNRRS